MNELRFSIPEILSLIGVTQCVYILVYVSMRAGKLSRAGLPLAYFLILGLAFSFDFAQNAIGQYWDYYYYLTWAAWAFGPPLSALMIIQIAQIHQTPALKHYWLLILVPIDFVISALIVIKTPECAHLIPCDERQKWLVLSGFVAGCLSLLAIWLNREALSFINDKKTGKDRYWLILAIAFADIFFLLTMILSMGGQDLSQIALARTILGLALVYLVGTSLFRIYPQAVVLTTTTKTDALSSEEMAIAQKIESLIAHEKVYHESGYGRADLARECQTSEAVISKVINVHFRKSFPQLISEYRIADAKILLHQTEADIKTVAEEVGFSSLASFNRVFREIAGETPSEYRKKTASVR